MNACWIGYVLVGCFLVVKECAQTLIDNTPVLDEYESQEDWDRGYGRAMRDCIHHIKEHFGVE